jgi:mannose-6-phosphate isomerase-like protein (cupin superfamily)
MMRTKAGAGRRVDLCNGHLIELARDLRDRWSLAVTVVQARRGLTRHFHRESTELYFGLSGSGSVQIGADLVPLCPGDLIRIDPGEAHHAIASRDDLTFLALTVPAFDPKDFFPVDATS